MKTKKKPIYLLDYRLTFKTFKALQDKLVDKSGLCPMGLDKMLWQMLRDKQIYCWFDDDRMGDLGLGLEIPKNRPVQIITNPKK